MRFLGLDRGADDATLESLADPGVSTDQRAELALVDRLLRGMKPALRLAWMLRRVDGLELGEVASLCDCSLATIKRRIVEADAIVDRHVAEPHKQSPRGRPPRLARLGGRIMSRLRYPLKDLLGEPTGEEALARVWRGIDARAPQRRGRARVWAMASVAAVAAVAIVFATFERRDRGPLRFADGRPLGAVEAPAAGAVLSMSDGSRVELAAGAAVRAARVDRHLVRGGARARERALRGPSGRPAALAD